MSIDTFTLSDSWRRWIAENVLVGTDEARIVEVLVEQGLTTDDARAAVYAARSDPHLAPGAWMTQRLRKLESLVACQERLRALDPTYAQVSREWGLTSESFLRDYYAASRPVILTDVADTWPALERWTPEYFVKRMGDLSVEVMTSRETDARYEEHLDAHRTRMTFADYVEKVESSGSTNDFYLVANNHFLEEPLASSLLADLVLDERLLDPSAPPSRMFFWYGPAGTVTPLHHDTSNVLLTQVRGRKRVTLIPALEAPMVYNDVAVYSPVDPENPDLGSYERFVGTTPRVVTLEVGEALFIPVGWWHHVRSLEVSVSVSFTNFVFPNDFDWAFPDIFRG